MGIFSRLFGKGNEPAETTSPAEGPLVPTPVPPLVSLLWSLEQQKGSPLTEEEVLQTRDTAVCIMLPLSKKMALEEARGYGDIDPENCWEEWQQARAHMMAGGQAGEDKTSG